MKTSEMQELLFATMPMWHYHVAKPFKRLLDEGISLDMYYCVQILRRNNSPMAMSELAHWMRIPKQQVTKVVNKLIECGFAERLYDSSDRRIIRLRLTEKAVGYVDKFLSEDAVYFKNMFDSMSENDRKCFGEALSSIHQVFGKMKPKECPCGNNKPFEAKLYERK